MSTKLNRVRQGITSPIGVGGPLVLNASAFSNAHTTIASAGGVDQITVTYVIEEGTDFEIQKGIWTLSSNQLTRNTPILSSISGTTGTTKMSLAGAATIRVIEEAGEMSQLKGSRAVSGATDTIANSDGGWAIVYTRSTAIAVALATPSGNSFASGWCTFVRNTGAGTVTITVSGGATISGGTTSTTVDIPQNYSAFIWSDGTNYNAGVISPVIWDTTLSLTTTQQSQARATVGSSLSIPLGRLSLVGGSSVPLADQIAKTAIKFTAHIGTTVPVYDGVNVKLVSCLSDLTLNLDGNAAHSQYVSTGNTYDAFIAIVSGVTYFGHSPAWASSTTRTSAISRSATHGLLVNTASMTIRYGSNSGDTIAVPAGQATWLGAFYSTGLGTTEDSAVNRFLANAYNAVPRDMYSTVTSNLATIDAGYVARAGAMRLNWMHIEQNGAVSITQNLVVSNNTAGGRIESYLRSDGSVIEESIGVGTSANTNDLSSFANGIVKNYADGLHYIESLQHNNGGTGTIYGNTVGGANLRSTIKGTVMA